ncbi:helix-turn-helix domain-containing protein, partial [Selenomonas sputigena]
MKQADNNKKNKHLTAQDRQEIMNGLDRGLSFKAIALLVQKDPTTISY